MPLSLKSLILDELIVTLSEFQTPCTCLLGACVAELPEQTVALLDKGLSVATSCEAAGLESFCHWRRRARPRCTLCCTGSRCS